MTSDIRELVRNFAEAERALRQAVGGRTVVEGVGEWIACRYYGGQLARGNTNGFDLIAADGRRIQAKARTAVTAPQFEHEPGLNFDLSLCIWLSKDLSKVLMAWEVTPQALRASGRFSSKGDPMITQPQLRRGGDGITDVTTSVARVWN
ncbi:hypothetical protein [Myxococcus sp. AS-1-15]|uniref:DUF6998 domain-containing protein n=1 Tax=Myxococcus sp. AS-1-15 TaxID=2874600 RepID=UPI001CC0AB9C|nr:hypothetical protein [Myxococcus sp. AS-1-15]MBZ4401597.1 hypothetical protein [Myxococcus sp. AS-1-15]BDT35539.1 hypothetical protein MFMH1_52080 [Myxococcus sp. MH1]